jgi:signal transduction histidine kinase
VIVSILALIAGIISLALAGIVVAEGTNTRNMRIAYTTFAGSVGLWAIFLGLFLLVDSNKWANFFVPAYYSVGLLIPYAFLFFSLAYLSIPVSVVTRLFALLPWAAMTALIMTPGMMIGTIDGEAAKTVELVQASYLLYAAIFIVFVIMGTWFLVSRAARAKGVQKHRRIVAASLIIGFLGGGFFDIILPLFGNYELIAYGPLFAFVTSAGIFYVIARHGLFDIRLTVVRTMNYLLTLATLGALYLIVAYIVFNMLLGQNNSSTQLLFNLGLTILLALLFQPVKLLFDRWTNRFFYRYAYDTEEVFTTLNRLLSSTTDLQRLLSSISNYLSLTLKAKQVFFFVYLDEDKFMSVGTQGHAKMPLIDVRWLDGYVGLNGGTIIRDQADVADSEIHRFMVSHRIEIAVPLVKEDTIIGYLYLGEHQKNNYTMRDIRLLETVSSELVIAIQNALSVHEIKDLNSHLEQRVDAATKELRRSNAQLQKLDESKDEFISMASHQLRTPLTSIKGYISMMMEGDMGKITDEQKHILNEAFMSSERMVRLISDFLNVSRLQTGKFVIEKHPVDLALLVQREIEGLTPNAQARGMKFIYKKPKNIPELELDENKIQQVVMNFSDNALYYSKENGKITVTLKKVPGWVELIVKDQGIGVPEEERAHLFNKFFRASNAKRARPDGTGVGLFLAKKVIDEHDGQIIFESKEGKGSSFGFRLPLPKKK